jgi:hypothetical protein
MTTSMTMAKTESRTDAMSKDETLWHQRNGTWIAAMSLAMVAVIVYTLTARGNLPTWLAWLGTESDPAAHRLIPPGTFDKFDGPAWVQAIGSIAAIWVGFEQARRQRAHAARHQAEIEHRSHRATLAAVSTITNRIPRLIWNLHAFARATLAVRTDADGKSFLTTQESRLTHASFALDRVDLRPLDTIGLELFLRVTSDLRAAIEVDLPRLLVEADSEKAARYIKAVHDRMDFHRNELVKRLDSLG